MNEIITDRFEFRIIEAEILEDNTLLTVQVVSDHFSAISTFDLNIESVAWFAKNLVEMYEKLSGSAELHDLSFGTPYIKFTMENRGYVHVEGKLIDGIMLDHSHELTFQNDFDQTYLREYAYSLLREYEKYL